MSECPIARVCVDLALDREFDYRIPPALRVRVGDQVQVPFGRSTRVGYVVALVAASARDDLKEIQGVRGERPMIGDVVLRLARWMAEYYCAPVEHAIRTVLPGAVRRKSASFRRRRFAVLADPVRAEDPERCTDKQRAVLAALRAAAGRLTTADLRERAGVTDGVLRTAVNRGWVRIEEEDEFRRPGAGRTILRTEPLPLVGEQAAALERIRSAIDTRKPPVVLLHGVTGSGKTEVYLQGIAHALAQGRGAIVLVPEISLTPQTVERFTARFGDRVAVLHSNLSDGERHDEWHRLQRGEATIAIGARSAVFAPVEPLGLIVVDEEHEPSYKQDEAPRYHARDVAVMRGRMEGVAVVLGSATPSFESTRNARIGKYGLAVLAHRVDHRRMPTIHVVDMRVEAQRTGRPGVFSQALIDALHHRLRQGEQTMLFLNRRGFASQLQCPKCGFVAQCTDCSISMTYHRTDETLRCHLCGAQRSPPAACPQCADPAYRLSGVGTQRVEDILRRLLPKARVTRMDADAVTHRDAYETILNAFRDGEIDILIGTQMIAKGLHFPNVTLVGVVMADMGLHLPDFRAGERTFQLLTQVAGRAGRGDVNGDVYVQTYTPHHPAIVAAQQMDYDGYYEREIASRAELLYPPAAHLVCVTLRGQDDRRVADYASGVMEALAPRLGSRVLAGGPAPAPIARIKKVFRHQIMLRARSVREITTPLREVLLAGRPPAGVHWQVDVDAVNLL